MVVTLPITTGMERSLILVADDDMDIRLLVARRLERAGYDVLAARNGTEALELTAMHDPDLLLLDVAMPDQDGYAVCRAMMEQHPSPPPVIFLTARGSPADLVLGLEAGAVDYVVKPFDAAELLARVAAALRTRTRITSLERDASVDRLTGLLNRAQLDDRLTESDSRMKRTGGTLACILLDIDNFKSINDRFGHLVGDDVLREVAKRLRAGVRASDPVFRYGGEEFLVLLEGTEVFEATAVAEKLLDAIATTSIGDLNVTASAGVGVWSSSLWDPTDLLGAADAALYEAKRAGRGRVVGPSRAAA